MLKTEAIAGLIESFSFLVDEMKCRCRFYQRLGKQEYCDKCEFSIMVEDAKKELLALGKKKKKAK